MAAVTPAAALGVGKEPDAAGIGGNHRLHVAPAKVTVGCLVLGVASASVFAEFSGRTQPWKMGGGAGLPPVCPLGAPHPVWGQSGASTRAPHPLRPSSSSFQLQESGSCLGWLCAARSHERSGAEMSEGGSSPCPVLRARCAPCAFAGEPLPPVPWGGDGRGGEGMQISAAGKPGAVCRRQLRANPCLLFFPFFRQKLLKG